MARFYNFLKQIAKLAFLLVAPVLFFLLWLLFVLRDLFTSGEQKDAPDQNSERLLANRTFPDNYNSSDLPSASIVIPNWNGKDLLGKFLPSVLAATRECDEIIVVDNASTDGSADFLRHNFPKVRVIEPDHNLGFGGGSNLGIQSASNRIVVLLNNDMRATPGFLEPLLAGFRDDRVFAVSAQIFFSDSARRREETGLTSGSFHKGFIRVRHDIFPDVNTEYPIFYAGGGSTAYDRDKFLELGGFDSLFEPFYLEDTDLSYCAWRRGWTVLYQPNSHLYHEHRGTIGKHFSRESIRAYLDKNYVLMVWKNVHRKSWLASHFLYLYSHMVLCWIGRHTETRTSIGAFFMALRALPIAMKQRKLALGRARITDTELFGRSRASVYHDTFRYTSKKTDEHTAARNPAVNAESVRQVRAIPADRSRLNILFVSPYSIYPPIHGGAVFMLEAIRSLSKNHNVFVLTFVDRQDEVESNQSLEGLAAKVEVFVRQNKSNRNLGVVSNAENTFQDPAFAAILDRMVYLHNIDLIQFEYTQLAQYRLPLRHIPQCLFEHDVYFHSVARHLSSGSGSILVKAKTFLEWLRALRFEIAAVGQFDAVFTCNQQEKRLLESFLRHPAPPVYSDGRVAIDVSSYAFPGGERPSGSMLFVGNFQHRPNVDAILYFCAEILPLIRIRIPTAKLSVVGANLQPTLLRTLRDYDIDLRGKVPDIREPMSNHAVFVCPIRIGAGVRVKILECFAAGIPVVSTSLGAEGLDSRNGAEIMLADSPTDFAYKTVELLLDEQQARAMALSARNLVKSAYDWPVVSQRLESIYWEIVAKKTAGVVKKHEDIASQTVASG